MSYTKNITRMTTSIIATQPPKNLVFSLPNELMAKVFRYDKTYRIFDTIPFRNDLFNKWLKTKEEQCICEVQDFMDNLIDMGGEWYNEYGYISDDDWGGRTSGSRKRYQSSDDFEVLFYFAKDVKDVMYFKIFPKNNTAKWRKERGLYSPRFCDGFFCHRNKNDFFLSDDANSDNIRCNPVHITGEYIAENGDFRTFDPIMYHDLCMWV